MIEMNTRKIRVIHFQLSENLGGIESFLLNVYKNIDREKYQFDFVTSVDTPANGNELTRLGGKIYKIPTLRQPIAFMISIHKVLYEGKYDIVHIHKNSAINIIPIIVAKLAKSPKIIVHSHNTQPSTKTFLKWIHFLNRKLFLKAGITKLACSKAAGNWLFGKDGDFQVIVNGVDTDKYRFDVSTRERLRLSLGLDQDDFVIGNIGRFTPQKNQKRLVKIFSIAHQNNQKMKLLLIGDGPEREQVKRLVRSLGLNTSVKFLGVRHDIPQLLQAMDTMLMPSLYEGLPIVAVEAQAAGLSLLISTTVTPEVIVTQDVETFSLEDRDSNIADVLQSLPLRNQRQRIESNLQVKQSGYDINHTVELLSSQYSG